MLPPPARNDSVSVLRLLNRFGMMQMLAVFVFPCGLIENVKSFLLGSQAVPRMLWEHMAVCQVDLTNNDIDILGSTSKGEKQLLTLEALYQKDISPNLNTKEEYKSRKLLIKF